MMIKIPQIIAHRGASHQAPENTLPSAHLAWQENADALECDIHQTLDGELVVIHDADTLRTTGIKKIIKESTLTELRQLDAGSWKDSKYAHSKIPTLKELISTVPGDRRIIIEIKCGFSCLPDLEKILEKSHLTPKQITLLEFDEKTVFEAKKHFPNLEVLFLYEFFGTLNKENYVEIFDQIIKKSQKINADGINPEINLFIDNALISRVHKLGKSFYCWTVNEGKRARQLAIDGIDGITTDKPGWLKMQLENNR